jgi:hypothetical protein
MPTVAFQSISGDGHVTADSPLALKEEGTKAFNAGDIKRAGHMFTLGIDLILQGKEPKDAAAWFSADAASAGVLHLLLSNRSLAFLKVGDAAGAADDAEHACAAKPDFAKGHLRLLAALAAMPEDTVEARRKACLRGIRACPSSKELRDAKANLDLEKHTSSGGKGGEAAATTDEDAEASAQLVATRKIADDPSDPRRAMAAGDVGSAFAVGAYSLPKDVALAQRYLRIGAAGGDAGSQRCLGLLLLEEGGAPEEAAEFLSAAAQQGDEQAADVLAQLGKEADEKRKAAMFKLRALASGGDLRAKEMLVQLEAEEGVTV